MKKATLLAAVLAFVLHSIIFAQNMPAAEKNLPDTVNRSAPNGDKYGYWIEKQGEMTFKGWYQNNKKVNDWIGYYANNTLYKLEYFKDGVKDGISVQFDRKLKVSLVEYYKNGLLEGTTILYNQFSEFPQSETEYVNGKKSGIYRQYYDNNKIQEETHFRDDQKTGLSRWYNKNGKLLAEYNYANGVFDGLQKTYYENDTLQAVTFYKNNQLSGESKDYYRNGKLKLTGSYVNGKKEGPWTEYNELGKVDRVVRYKEGVETGKK